MKRLHLAIFLLLSFTLTAPLTAEPLGWESDFGDPIASLTGQDDSEDDVTLSFPFPFEGTTYTTVFVGTNGALQLEDLGNDGHINYEMSDDLTEFYDDGGYPVISALNTDLDATTTGTVHFKDFGDRAVFTWNEIGTNAQETHLSSLQIQLFPDGTIYFSYNGILDGPGEDLVDSLDIGIVVGVSGSTGTDPGPVDFSNPTDTNGDTAYEIWKWKTAPENSLFDLDQKTLVFSPKTGGGFTTYFLDLILTTGTGSPVMPDLLIGKTATTLKGDGLRNPKNPSAKQTVTNQCQIFTTNTQTAVLALQNDGTAAGALRLTTSGDRFERMDVSAQSSPGGNVTASLLTGKFAPNIAAGGSVRVTYRLRTDRFFAGVLRGGDRDNTVLFRLSGGGLADNAAMTNRYR
jgi:hypothetical protein